MSARGTAVLGRGQKVQRLVVRGCWPAGAAVQKLECLLHAQVPGLKGKSGRQTMAHILKCVQDHAGPPTQTRPACGLTVDREAAAGEAMMAGSLSQRTLLAYLMLILSLLEAKSTISLGIR